MVPVPTCHEGMGFTQTVEIVCEPSLANAADFRLVVF